MVITHVPAKIPGLDACVACVVGKSVHLPHKEGGGRASEYLERVHIDMCLLRQLVVGSSLCGRR